MVGQNQNVLITYQEEVSDYDIHGFQLSRRL